jgi:hypothetical protein
MSIYWLAITGYRTVKNVKHKKVTAFRAEKKTFCLFGEISPTQPNHSPPLSHTAIPTNQWWVRGPNPVSHQRLPLETRMKTPSQRVSVFHLEAWVFQAKGGGGELVGFANRAETTTRKKGGGERLINQKSMHTNSRVLEGILHLLIANVAGNLGSRVDVAGRAEDILVRHGTLS